MTEVPYYTIRVGDRDIRVVEPVRQKRDRFWQWEYWALKEHQTMKQEREWIPYIDKVVMKMDIPKKIDGVQEVEQRPKLNEKHFAINVRVPLSKMQTYEDRMDVLERNWRELLLYPVMQEGLVHDFHEEITGKTLDIKGGR